MDSFSKLAVKYIRVEKPELGGVIKKFGHIINDKWFDYNEFYKE